MNRKVLAKSGLQPRCNAPCSSSLCCFLEIGGGHRAAILMTLFFLCSSPAEAVDISAPPPATCAELDQSLATEGTLSQFLLHGLDQGKAGESIGDRDRFCRTLREGSAYASALIGITSFCNSQQQLNARGSNNVLYRRIGDAARRIGNGFDDLSRKNGC